MTVLLVDDEPDIRDTLAELLGLEGYATEQARDGLEALAMIRRHRPEVAVLDVLMPRMDGVELYRQMQLDPELASVPVIFSTSDPTRVPPGVVVVPKPVDVKAFFAAVRNASRTRRAP